MSGEKSEYAEMGIRITSATTLRIHTRKIKHQHSVLCEKFQCHHTENTDDEDLKQHFANALQIQYCQPTEDTHTEDQVEA